VISGAPQVNPASPASPADRPEWSTVRQALLLVARGATLSVAGRVALLVGTVLSAANQGSVIASGDATWVTWVRVGVNYLTPFAVASFGYLAGCRTQSRLDREGKR
jgi:hypothetical protein